MRRLDCALIVCILAVGTAASTAVFSLYDQVFFRPLPYPAPHEIVSLRLSIESSIFTGVRIVEGRIPEGVFLATGLMQPAGVNVTANRATFRAPAAVVNAGFFQVMGVTPLAGRTFSIDEEQTGRVAVRATARRADDPPRAGACQPRAPQPLPRCQGGLLRPVRASAVRGGPQPHTSQT